MSVLRRSAVHRFAAVGFGFLALAAGMAGAGHQFMTQRTDLGKEPLTFVGGYWHRSESGGFWSEFNCSLLPNG